MSTFRFGIAILCIDGRIHEPVVSWLRSQYQLDYVDLITEPGADRALTLGHPELNEAIREKLRLSIQNHDSKWLAIVGHHDCAANPVSRDLHIDQIRRALQVVRSWYLPLQLVGLWLDENGEIRSISD
jgi:hypothetical protein